MYGLVVALQLEERFIPAYLRRIGAERPRRPDSTSLASLQVAHLKRVPFENLDIARGVPILLDLGGIAAKVIDRSRGGYCYELNGLFGALLESLGFGVDLVSGRVAGKDGNLKQDFGHLALIVHAPEHEEPFLVDVGFGDGSTSPIPLVSGEEHRDRDRMVRVCSDGTEWSYQEDRGEGWLVRYGFTPMPRRLADFASMNAWQQVASSVGPAGALLS